MIFPFPIQGSLDDEDYAALGQYYAQPRNERNADDIAYIMEKYGFQHPSYECIANGRSVTDSGSESERK